MLGLLQREVGMLQDFRDPDDALKECACRQIWVHRLGLRQSVRSFQIHVSNFDLSKTSKSEELLHARYAYWVNTYSRWLVFGHSLEMFAKAYDSWSWCLDS
jgi:hypothetical protein